MQVGEEDQVLAKAVVLRREVFLAADGQEYLANRK